MKELSIEEKAKRYDEAIKKLCDFYRDYDTVSHLIDVKEELANLFPELVESEDEKIVNAIRKALESKIEDLGNGVTRTACLAWLEKQGEHKKFRDSIQVGDEVTRNSDGVIVNLSQLKRVAKKSEQKLPIEKLPEKMKTIGESLGFTTQEECDEYNEMVTNLIMGDDKGEQKSADKVEPFDKYEGLTDFEKTLADICIGWIGEELGWKQYIKDNADVLLRIAVEKFNSVQDAPFEQNHAWSEEDEKMIEAAINLAHEYGRHGLWVWLKSLKERCTWKPSDAQMEVLVWCKPLFVDPKSKGILESLINDLKKLKGE